MSNKFIKRTYANVRSLNTRMTEQRARGSVSSHTGRRQELMLVKISAVDVSLGFPLYEVLRLGINRTETAIKYVNVRGVDDSIQSVVGDVRLMFIDEIGRRLLINSGGGSGASGCSGLSVGVILSQ